MEGRGAGEGNARCLTSKTALASPMRRRPCDARNWPPPEPHRQANRRYLQPCTAWAGCHRQRETAGNARLEPAHSASFRVAGWRDLRVALEDIPARWWKPQPPKLDQDGLTKAIRAREKALKEASRVLTDALK
jgi:hypothetical protein